MYILKIALISTIIGYMVSSVFTAAATSVPDATTPGAIESIMRVSLAHDGAEVRSYFSDAAVSADGTTVAFSCDADEMTVSDSNGRRDILVRDLASGALENIGPTEGTTRIDGAAYNPTLSADGQIVAFVAYVDMSPEWMMFEHKDIFVYDRQSGEGLRISVGFDGMPADNTSMAPGISADGRYVAFISFASNMVAGVTPPKDSFNTYLYDRATATLSCLTCQSAAPAPAPQPAVGNDDSYSAPSFSADGRYLAFASRSNLLGGYLSGISQVYRYDLQTGELVLLSATNDGAYGDARSVDVSLSGDGNLAVFTSSAGNFGGHKTDLPFYATAVYLRDVATGTTTPLTPGLDISTGVTQDYAANARISADGRYVVLATNGPLSVEDPDRDWPQFDVYRLDRETGMFQLVTRPLPEIARGYYEGSYFTALSADGRTVVFCSAAANLVANDTNRDDVFVANFGPEQPIVDPEPPVDPEPTTYPVYLPLVER